MLTRSSEGWKTSAERRKFFDKFAKSNNFDPLEADNWYSVSRVEITNAVSKVISFSL